MAKIGTSIANSQLPGGSDYVVGAAGTSTITNPPPINTSQPNPATVNATPYTGIVNPDGSPMTTPPGVSTQTLPGGMTTTPNSLPAGSTQFLEGQVQGTLPGETALTTFQSADIAKQYGAALAQTKATTPIAPQTAAEASPKVQSALKANPVAPSTANIDTALANDPGYQQILADRAEYNNVANQSKSLLDFYNQAIKDAGLPTLNAQLLNYEKIINGTEDSIRQEIQASGGMANEGQILSLSLSRNKQLVQNYNNLLASKNMAMESINNMTSLASQDRAFALDTISQKMQFDQQINQYRDKFINNAIEGYNAIIKAVGYQGLLQSLNDPSEIALVEKTLGLQPGQMQQIVSAQQAQTNLAELADYNVTTPYIITASGEVRNTQTGEGYTDPQDFQAKTGLTLDEAGQKGLIKPLGATTKQEQQKFDNSIKVENLNIDKAQLGVSQYNAQTSRMNANQPDTSIVDIGNGQKAIVTIDKAGNILNQQPISTGSNGTNELSLAKTQNNISLINDVIDKLKTPTSVSVGPNFTRDFLVNPFGSKKADFIAGVQQLTSQLTLDSLIQAKAQGATFGALSEGELKILESSAGKIQNWAIKDKQGNVTGYNTSAKSFRAELDRINDLAKLDYIIKGGDSSQVGVQQEADGSLTTLGSDGKVHQIYP